MKEKTLPRSRVDDCGGVPTLFVNGAPFPAAAYMTYLTENNDYAAFAGAGYRLFSVPMLCAGRWINAAADLKPFHGGIFDREDAPDYTHVDDAVDRILSVCPDAYIFPRLNLSMPLWWIEKHPGCTDGTGKRELLFTKEYRETAADMLRAVIRHVEGGDYADRIVGYQLTGGNTEEWFHFDLNGGLCANAEGLFSAWLAENDPAVVFSGLPNLALLKGESARHRDALLEKYLEFASRAVSDTVRFLCAEAKKATGGRLAVGTFYGYSLEVASPLWGTHALQTLLNGEEVDFICSPNSYIGTRDPAADWTEMYPAASVRLHGKLCMQECDVRTHLTRPLARSSPVYADVQGYDAPIWQPLKDRDTAAAMLRKTFARQLIAGNGFWWFDMWGGWYRDPVLMEELKRMRALCADALAQPDRASVAQVAAFVDESAYAHLTEGPLCGAAYHLRTPLRAMGAPYDLYDLSDFDAVYKRYRAIVFLSPAPTAFARRAREICEAEHIPFLAVSEEKTRFSAGELRAFCRVTGVHVFCETDDLIYVNARYLAVYATSAGEKTVILDGVYRYRELMTEDGLRGASDTLRFPMKKYETKLFELFHNRG